jgi:hypothetical protein
MTKSSKFWKENKLIVWFRWWTLWSFGKTDHTYIYKEKSKKNWYMYLNIYTYIYIFIVKNQRKIGTCTLMRGGEGSNYTDNKFKFYKIHRWIESLYYIDHIFWVLQKFNIVWHVFEINQD